MRSSVLLSAIGLLTVHSALAATNEVTTGSATSAPVETSVASSVETQDTTVTTVDAETTTTAEINTTAETTTTDALATPTFAIVGGGGSVNGASLQGGDQDGSTLLFNPQVGNLRSRTFILDPNTGRIRDKDTGVLVCAYYGYSTSPSTPAYIGFCQIGNTGPNQYYDYLTCKVTDGKLGCTAPRASCTDDDNGFTTCVTDPGNDLNDQFYYKFQSGAGDRLYISSGSPSGYTAVDIIARES
ncbi:hypothetical protein ACHAQI_004624 [Fusarium lateritium]